MSKPDRRAQITAEIERRCLESGVPREKYVYAMRPRHGDEGGPRSYAPTLCLKNWENAQKDESAFDGGLLRRLLDEALEQGSPIEIEPRSESEFAPGAPLADYCEADGRRASLMIFSERAASALEHLLRPSCVKVAIHSHEHNVVAYNLKAEVAAIDVARSDVEWFAHAPQTLARPIKSYHFIIDRLGHHAIFVIPQHREKLVLQPFVDVVRAGAFNGFRFRQVWPSMGVEVWD